MADYDPTLGEKVHQHLQELNLETPFGKVPSWGEVKPYDVIATAQKEILKELGLDLKDDSLADTPKRVSKMYTEELFYGLDYSRFPKTTVFDNKGNYDEMLATAVSLFSTCEHHFLPFIGTAHIAYIPGNKFVGLSKFNRIVDFFARRPQVQERLTEQIAAAFRFILQTEDVAVVLRAEHYCVKIRGVKDACGDTVTSKMSGRFRTVDSLRQEFLLLTGAHK